MWLFESESQALTKPVRSLFLCLKTASTYAPGLLVFLHTRAHQASSGSPTVVASVTHGLTTVY